MKVTSKRRRTKQEIEFDRIQSAKKEREIAEKLREHATLASQLKDAEDEADRLKGVAKLVKVLVDKGVLQVDEAGNILRAQPNSQMESHA